MQPRLFGYDSWYLFWTLAVAIGVIINVEAIRRRGLPPIRSLVLLGMVLPFAVAGTRLAYIWEMGIPLSQALTSGGFRLPGALVATLIVFPPFALTLRLPPLVVLDAMAPGLTVLISVGRIGCFLNGCCFGAPTSMPWGVAFPKNSEPFTSHEAHGLISPDAATSLPVHPLSLYFSLDGILILLFLLWFTPRARYQGQVFLWFLLLRCGSKFTLEYLRGASLGTLHNRSGEIAFWLALVAGLTLIACALSGYRSGPRSSET